MKVRVDRDSVSAGDDTDSHAAVVTIEDAATLETAIRAVVSAYRLPSIAGGQATWCVSCDVPVAVVSQQSPEPRMLPWVQFVTRCNPPREGLTVYFSYLAQVDPDVVFDVLRRVRLEPGQ
jgi:hypothetical protein